MSFTTHYHEKKFFIGLELRTDNTRCSIDMPSHKEKFFKENIVEKIPNKISDSILALYTNYEGDKTQPYSWILGSEVSTLDVIPKGLVGKEIDASKYAVFTTQGEFPQGLITVWQTIWTSNLMRSYKNDFEVYHFDFDPINNPEVKVFIGINN